MSPEKRRTGNAPHAQNHQPISGTSNSSRFAIGWTRRRAEAATSGGFDCAIVDLKLHGQETFEVARILTERNIPFAFFTGYAADSLREYASQSVLPKPFGEADLKGILDHLLRSDGSG